MRLSFPLLPFCLPVVLISQNATAALLAYDGFNTGAGGYTSSGGYANPSPGPTDALVYGNPPGTGQAPATLGFSAGWIGGGGSIASSVYTKVEALQEMNYTAGAISVATTTGQANLHRSSGSSSDSKVASRALNLENGGINTFSTLYYSGFFRYEGAVTASYIESGMGLDIASSRKFAMNVAVDGTLSLTGGGSTPVSTSAGAIVAGQTYFYVWKVLNNGSTGDSMTLYLNPLSLAAEGDNTSTLTLTGGNFAVANTANYYVTHLRFGSNITNGNEFLLDEFRVGTTWADVIPEPSSLLFSLAGLGFLMRRRR